MLLGIARPLAWCRVAHKGRVFGQDELDLVLCLLALDPPGDGARLTGRFQPGVQSIGPALLLDLFQQPLD